MKIANYYYLGQLLSALNTCSRQEEAEINSIDPDDEEAVRAIIRIFIRPDFEQLSDASKERTKDALQYFSTTRNAPFHRILAAQQDSPLGYPDEPIQLFIWIWKELFPNESYELKSTLGWIEENDLLKVRLSLSDTVVQKVNYTKKQKLESE
jgi:hypothetical protein